MKTSLSIVVLTASLGLTSCEFFMPYDRNQGKGRDYQRGVAEGRAQVVRQKYWDEQNRPPAAPPLEKRYTPIIVPEHRTPDGLLIEVHTEYVETVR